MEPITRVIYYSRNCITGSPADISSSIFRLLAQARIRNAKSGLTGALMFNLACFAQVLEGSKDVVEQTYCRIMLDKRHSDIVLLARGVVEQRFFPHWSMAYIGHAPAEADQFEDIAQQTGFDPVGMTSDAVLLTLQGLVEGTAKPAHIGNACGR